eukprot:1307588-Amphidinium_carterae.2
MIGVGWQTGMSPTTCPMVCSTEGVQPAIIKQGATPRYRTSHACHREQVAACAYPTAPLGLD